MLCRGRRQETSRQGAQGIPLEMQTRLTSARGKSSFEHDDSKIESSTLYLFVLPNDLIPKTPQLFKIMLCTLGH
jgi:hypothetical protein